MEKTHKENIIETNHTHESLFKGEVNTQSFIFIKYYTRFFWPKFHTLNFELQSIYKIRSLTTSSIFGNINYKTYPKRRENETALFLQNHLPQFLD